MVDIYRAVSKVVFWPRSTRTTTRSDNPIYELIYVFSLHCHLLGNFRIRSRNFDNNGFRSRETVNINNCINNSGDLPVIRLWKITNSLAILRLRKPLKTSTGLAGHRIWTQDLPNASLVHYHGVTSLDFTKFLRTFRNIELIATVLDYKKQLRIRCDKMQITAYDLRQDEIDKITVIDYCGWFISNIGHISLFNTKQVMEVWVKW